MDIKPPSKRPPQKAPVPLPQLLSDELPILPLLEETNDHKIPPSRKKRLLVTFLVSIGILVLLVAGAFWWYFDGLRPIGGDSRHIRVAVEQGSSASMIAKQLADAKVIKNEFIFNLYLKITGKKAKLQAGNYAFSPHQSVQEIVQHLEEGKVEAYNVTILPGKTLADIKAGLIKDGFSGEEIDKAFAKQYAHPLLADKPPGVPLEGYIYPETFQISPDSTVEALLERSFDEFYKKITEMGLIEQLKTQNLTLYQGVVLASIVQLEVTSDTDRATVSQVFLKRLRDGMVLGSDPTYKYAAKLLNQPVSIDIDSPYNTRKYPGLPPSAIGNFHVGVLHAVANPTATSFVYFVSGDDGKTHFSTTFEEHEENIRKYCTTLCQQP